MAGLAASIPSEIICFYPGSTVKCITCHDEKIEGNVLAYDHVTKFLALKQTSSSGKIDKSDVILLNVQLLRNVEVLKASEASLATLSALNTSKLVHRYAEEVSLKMTLALAKENGVSNDGIQLYNYLRKAMPIKTVKWAGQDISVMEEVLVKPPYRLENCVFLDPVQSNNQCLNHVRNVVERFHKEELLKTKQTNST